MILKKIYDENTHTQKVWYDSTMIFYSEMVESQTENKGDLYITFKTGAIYKYKDVKLEDYVLFVGGGTDASQGKTLNKIIKGKYEVEKYGNADMQALTELLNTEEEKTIDIANTYFISGHRTISDVQFEFYYYPAINAVLYANPNARFIMGDCEGADIMAQNYLIDILGIDPDRITVYHMLDAPRNCNPKITNLKGGFKSDDERDGAMTKESSQDIAFVRDCKENSGTAQNILRRKEMKNF